MTAKNYLKESLSSILCFIIQGKGSSWKRFDPEIYFVAILRRVRIFDAIEFLFFTHVMKKEGVFASNSKYVVCFKKYFAGKVGVYEFIMFYNNYAS